MLDLLKKKEPVGPVATDSGRRISALDAYEQMMKVLEPKAKKESNQSSAGAKQAEPAEKERAHKFASIRANADKRTWETESKPKDDFLEGFNYYSEKKEEPAKVTMKMQPIRTFGPLAAARNKYADSKVVEKPKDDFLEGFNYYSNGEKELRESPLQTRINETRQVLDFVPKFEFPTNYGTYKYVDRSGVYSKIAGEVPESVRKPTGQFGIALKNSPTVAMKNGKAQANYVFGFDTKYIGEKGNLKPLEIPQWNFDRDAIKAHNAERIDSIADTLAAYADRERKASIYSKAADMKAKQGLKVDEVAQKWEGLLNSVDSVGRKNKVNKIIAETTEKLPKILDSRAMKALKTGGKAASVAGDVLNAVNLGLTMSADYMDDGKLGKTSVKSAAGFIGDVGGSALGATIGAAAFGALGGVLSAGVLTAPLAAVGGYVGSVVGGILGEKIAKKTYEDLYGLAK